MVRGIPNISVPTIGYTVPQVGKMSLPVDSSSLIYSHFEHVSGIPAPEGTQGVTISKLKLLDVLIEQLNQVKKGANYPPPLDLQRISQTSAGDSNLQATRQGSSSGKSPDTPHFDALIENYVNQIRQARAASSAMPYIPSPSAQGGAVFSLVV